MIIVCTTYFKKYKYTHFALVLYLCALFESHFKQRIFI